MVVPCLCSKINKDGEAGRGGQLSRGVSWEQADELPSGLG